VRHSSSAILMSALGQKRTLMGTVVMSALCQKRTFYPKSIPSMGYVAQIARLQSNEIRRDCQTLRRVRQTAQPSHEKTALQ
jgi:hypothetical protein